MSFIIPIAKFLGESAELIFAVSSSRISRIDGKLEATIGLSDAMYSCDNFSGDV